MEGKILAEGRSVPRLEMGLIGEGRRPTAGKGIPAPGKGRFVQGMDKLNRDRCDSLGRHLKNLSGQYIKYTK